MKKPLTKNAKFKKPAKRRRAVYEDFADYEPDYHETKEEKSYREKMLAERHKEKMELSELRNSITVLCKQVSEFYSIIGETLKVLQPVIVKKIEQLNKDF